MRPSRSTLARGRAKYEASWSSPPRLARDSQKPRRARPKSSPHAALQPERSASGDPARAGASGRSPRGGCDLVLVELVERLFDGFAALDIPLLLGLPDMGDSVTNPRTDQTGGLAVTLGPGTHYFLEPVIDLIDEIGATLCMVGRTEVVEALRDVCDHGFGGVEFDEVEVQQLGAGRAGQVQELGPVSGPAKHGQGRTVELAIHGQQSGRAGRSPDLFRCISDDLGHFWLVSSVVNYCRDGSYHRTISRGSGGRRGARPQADNARAALRSGAPESRDAWHLRSPGCAPCDVCRTTRRMPFRAEPFAGRLPHQRAASPRVAQYRPPRSRALHHQCPCRDKF